MRCVELDATARLSTVRELLVATGAGPPINRAATRHTRSAGVFPAADPDDGAQLHHAVEPDHHAPAAAAPAATPWLITPEAGPAPRVEAWHHADLREEEELLTVIEGAGLPPITTTTTWPRSPPVTTVRGQALNHVTTGRWLSLCEPNGDTLGG